MNLYNNKSKSEILNKFISFILFNVNEEYQNKKGNINKWRKKFISLIYIYSMFTYINTYIHTPLSTPITSTGPRNYHHRFSIFSDYHNHFTYGTHISSHILLFFMFFLYFVLYFLVHICMFHMNSLCICVNYLYLF